MITPWPWPVTSQGLSWLQGQASSPLGEDDLPGDRLAAVEQGSGTSCHLARGRLHCPLPTHGPQAGAAALPGCTLPLLLFFLLPKGKACSGRGPLSPPTAISQILPGRGPGLASSHLREVWPEEGAHFLKVHSALHHSAKVEGLPSWARGPECVTGLEPLQMRAAGCREGTSGRGRAGEGSWRVWAPAG